MCQAIYPLTGSVEDATIWGAWALIAFNSAFLCIVLAGEYSTEDRPAPWRLTSLGVIYGIVWCFLAITLFSPPGTGLIYMTFIQGFGWILLVTPVYFYLNLLFAIEALYFFLEFCVKAFRAATNSTRFGGNTRKLVVTFILGFIITVVAMGGGWFFPDFAINAPGSTMISISLCIIYAFSILAKDYRLIFLLPQEATCLFVLNTSGMVYFDHMFQSDEEPFTSIGIFAPALAAVNFIVQESLDLTEDDWIKEFHTDERTFLLEVRADINLVGVLLVSKPTPMLRKALTRFIDLLSPLWIHNNKQLNLAPEEKQKVKQIITDAFPFILR